MYLWVSSERPGLFIGNGERGGNIGIGNGFAEALQFHFEIDNLFFLFRVLLYYIKQLCVLFGFGCASHLKQSIPYRATASRVRFFATTTSCGLRCEY